MVAPIFNSNVGFAVVARHAARQSGTEDELSIQESSSSNEMPEQVSCAGIARLLYRGESGAALDAEGSSTG
jgi:hypothetical protein